MGDAFLALTIMTVLANLASRVLSWACTRSPTPWPRWCSLPCWRCSPPSGCRAGFRGGHHRPGQRGGLELVGPMLVVRDLRRDAGAERPEAPGAVDHRLPRHVVVASAVAADVPDWVIDLCARSHAELTVAVYGEEGEDVVALRGRAGGRGVPFRFVSLEGESFAGAVIRAAREVAADLVVLLVAAADANRDAARPAPGRARRAAPHVPRPVLARNDGGAITSRRLLGGRLP